VPGGYRGIHRVSADSAASGSERPCSEPARRVLTEAQGRLMPTMVVDAAIALGWHIGDEDTPRVVRILDNVSMAGASSPRCGLLKWRTGCCWPRKRDG
jgi:hypothetical protein